MATKTPRYYTEDDYKQWCREQDAAEVSSDSFVDESELRLLIERFGQEEEKTEKPFAFPAPAGSPPSFADRLSHASVRAAVMNRKETFFSGSDTFACWWEDDILFWIECEPSLFPY